MLPCWRAILILKNSKLKMLSQIFLKFMECSL